MIGSRPPAARRRGMSLLEVTIGTMMAGMVAVLAAGVAVDMSRFMAGNIADTQIASEARLAIEALRRDFSGSSFDDTAGDHRHWRLVGRMIPSSTELRLCFDAQQDATADWIAPDRVVIYTHAGDQLIRTDQITGASYTVARYVDDVQFVAASGEISVLIDFAFGAATQSYTFVTADVP